MKNISTEEMVNDYYESKMDKEAHERLGFPGDHPRIRGNAAIMDVIEKELRKRGELSRIQR